MPVHQRFVILSSARSGSSLLVRSLNRHPDVRCRAEIFKAVKTSVSAEDLTRRKADPLRFAHEMLEAGDGRACAGFKMWRSQNPEVCDHLLGRPDVAKIILERRNRLAQYASLQLAKQSGIWNIKTADVVRQQHAQREQFKADFDRRSFLAYVRAGQDLFNHYRKTAKGPRLDISYNELVRTGLAPLFAFLGVPDQILPPSLERVRGADIVGRFRPEAHEAIRQTLAAIGRSAWAMEDLTQPEPEWRPVKPANLLLVAIAQPPQWMLRWASR